MNKEFNVGDKVYYLSDYEIYLGVIEQIEAGKKYPVLAIFDNKFDEIFTKGGRVGAEKQFQSLFHATKENYDALVTLYGEWSVPKPPLSRHEIIVELLKRQKYVLCKVSNKSYDFALKNEDPQPVAAYRALKNMDGVLYGASYKTAFIEWDYAIAIDNNGNEITELPDYDDE